MPRPQDIPASTYERAAILMDQLRNTTDDLEYTARIIMAVEQGGGDHFGLTEKQATALAFIETFVTEHGYAPSYDEIQQGLNIASKSGAHNIVRQLVRRGAIKTLTRRYRSIVVVKNRDVSTAHKNSVEA